MLAKVAQWPGAGAMLVWVVDPAQQKAVVYRGTGDVTIVGADGELDGDPVLAGFTCALADILR